MIGLVIAAAVGAGDTVRTYVVQYRPAAVSGIRVQGHSPQVVIKKGRKIVARGGLPLEIRVEPGNYTMESSDNRDRLILSVPESTLITVIIAPASPEESDSFRVIEHLEGVGTLRVYCNVAMANLFVDDLFVPTDYTPVNEGEFLEMQLPAGEHTVKISERGYTSWQARVMIYPDKITVVDTKLEPEK